MKFQFTAILSVLCVTYVFSQPKGLELNAKAPDFSGVDQSKKNISLSKLLKKGKVILVFYRGEWCPFCNKELKALEDSLSLISSKGANVLAITPEIVENVSKTVEKTKASYSILHDEGLKIMKAYDVAYAVDDKTIKAYQGYGIDFNKSNGSNGANLPVPAVYIINESGKIIYRYFDADFRKRPSVKELLSNL